MRSIGAGRSSRNSRCWSASARTWAACRQFHPQPNAREPEPDWLGGYFCPCHGSKYDLAGRVFKGVPAPYNLPVPPHRFVNDRTLRIGENPPNVKFDFASILQI